MAAIPKALADLIEICKRLTEPDGPSYLSSRAVADLESAIEAVETLEIEPVRDPLPSENDAQVFRDIDESEFLRTFIASALASNFELDESEAFIQAWTAWSRIVERIGVVNTKGA